MTVTHVDSNEAGFTPESIHQVDPATTEVSIDQQVRLDLTEAEDPTPEVDDHKFCPACGVNLGAFAEREIADEDKTLWLRHVLGEEKFTKVYPLYGGVVAIKLRTRTEQEISAIHQQLQQNPITMPGGGVDPMQVHMTHKYMVTYSLMSIVSQSENISEVVDFPPISEAEYPSEDGDTNLPIARACRERLDEKLPPGLITAMITAVLDFEQLVYVLQQRSPDPDFWPTTVVGA